jgi:hypothetical protein
MTASQNDRGQTDLGQIALAWFWDQRGDLIYPDDNGLVHAMVDLLVRDGQEEEVWRWMSSESTRSRRLPSFIQSEWRDTALKGLLLAKAKLSKNGSLDEVIETFLRSKTVFVPSGDATNWMFQQLTRYKRLQAHEISLSINGGRRWDHTWPNTSVELWDEAVDMVPHYVRDRPMHQALLAMFRLRTPNPAPIRMLFENALTELDHPLRDLRFIKSKNAFRSYAQYASGELRRIGRYDDAARLNKACE